MNKKSFSKMLDELDRIIASPIDDSSLSNFSSLIGDQTLREYAFNKLDNPEWIVPLFENGFFSNPPQPVKDTIKNTISYPRWAELNYLMRIGSKLPDVVCQIILNIPQTENIIVRNQIIEIALTLSPNFAALIADKEISWLEKQTHIFYSPYSIDCGALISYLAKNEYADTALKLARNLLGIIPPESSENNEKLFGFLRDARTKIDLWEYEQILIKDIPNLIEAKKTEALNYFCQLLKEAVALYRGEAESDYEDYSYIWRPYIDSSHHSGIKDLLVSTIRDGSKQHTKNAPEDINEIVNLFESYKWQIYIRLSLYLLEINSDNAKDLIVERLLNRTYFDDSGIQNEYFQLAKKYFKKLNTKQKNTFLGWINKGPDISHTEYRKRIRKLFGVSKTKDDYAEYVMAWKRDRLAPISESLPAKWAKIYQDLVNKVGKPEPLVEDSYLVADVVVDTSPKTFEELSNLTIDELISYLNAWQPTMADEAPSTAGLASMLTTLVESNPKEFAERAKEFCKLNLVYVNALILGLRRAVENEKSIDWGSVLELCIVYIEYPESEEDESIENRRLNSIKRNTVELLRSGFKDIPSQMPHAFQTLAGDVLWLLTRDPEPTPEYEKKYGGDNMDPATLSLNTVRGDAMHTLLHYALWIRRGFEKSSNAEELLDKGFEAMLDVRDILDEHLDTQNDPSLAVRSVYGQWYPWLFLLDEEWATNNVSVIFPEDEGKSDFRDAAWYSYLYFCPPYNNVFAALHDTYLSAVNRLGEPAKWKPHYNTPDERLTEHIMVYYLRGKISLTENEDDIINSFFVKASNESLNYAVRFIGNSFYKSKEKIPLEVIQRAKELWSNGFKSRTKSNARLIDFGWWFISNVFELTWIIPELLEIMQKSRDIEPENLVFEKLAKISNQYSLEAVECINLYIQDNQEYWKIYALQDEFRLILKNALNSENYEARALSIEAIDRLLAKGNLQFRDLLPKI